MAGTVIEAGNAGATPADLLKQAVTGARPASTGAEAASAKPKAVAGLRKWALPGAALVLGGLTGGMGATLSAPRQDHAGEALSQIQAGIEAGRLEAARLNGEIERIGRGITFLREAGEAARNDAKSRGAALSERVAKAELTIWAKVAALGERQEQIDRDHSARIAALTAQIDKKLSNAPLAQPTPQAAKAALVEPAQTGAIPDAKAKAATIDGWAVREVYDGIAMLEDRKRRLIEIGAGDMVPGIGRVEAIERRGKAWVVVTKQGIITSQTW